MFKRIIVTSLICVFSAQATLIKGEDSEAHFVQIKKVKDSFLFFDCQGILTDLTCEPLFDKSLTESQVKHAIKIEKNNYWSLMVFNTAMLAGTGVLMPILKGGKAIKKLKEAGASFDGGVVGVVYTLEGAKAAALVSIETAAIMYFDTFDAFINKDLMNGWLAIANEQETSVVTVQDLTTEEVIEKLEKIVRIVTASKAEKHKKMMERLENLNL